MLTVCAGKLIFYFPTGVTDDDLAFGTASGWAALEELLAHRNLNHKETYLSTNYFMDFYKLLVRMCRHARNHKSNHS